MSLYSALTVLRKVAQVALVVTLMAALGVAGADAARRTDAESRQATQADHVSVSQTPQVGPEPAPATPDGSMTPNSRPTTEQPAVLTAATAPVGNDRLVERDDQSSELVFAVLARESAHSDIRPVRSLAEVAPHVALVCTLVGAVPSGTM